MRAARLSVEAIVEAVELLGVATVAELALELNSTKNVLVLPVRQLAERDVLRPAGKDPVSGAPRFTRGETAI